MSDDQQPPCVCSPPNSSHRSTSSADPLEMTSSSTACDVDVGILQAPQAQQSLVYKLPERPVQKKKRKPLAQLAVEDFLHGDAFTAKKLSAHANKECKDMVDVAVKPDEDGDISAARNERKRSCSSSLTQMSADASAVAAAGISDSKRRKTTCGSSAIHARATRLPTKRQSVRVCLSKCDDFHCRDSWMEALIDGELPIRTQPASLFTPNRPASSTSIYIYPDAPDEPVLKSGFEDQIRIQTATLPRQDAVMLQGCGENHPDAYATGKENVDVKETIGTPSKPHLRCGQKHKKQKSLSWATTDSLVRVEPICTRLELMQSWHPDFLHTLPFTTAARKRLQAMWDHDKRAVDSLRFCENYDMDTTEKAEEQTKEKIKVRVRTPEDAEKYAYTKQVGVRPNQESLQMLASVALSNATASVSSAAHNPELLHINHVDSPVTCSGLAKSEERRRDMCIPSRSLLHDAVNSELQVGDNDTSQVHTPVSVPQRGAKNSECTADHCGGPRGHGRSSGYLYTKCNDDCTGQGSNDCLHPQNQAHRSSKGPSYLTAGCLSQSFAPNIIACCTEGLQVRSISPTVHNLSPLRGELQGSTHHTGAFQGGVVEPLHVGYDSIRKQAGKSAGVEDPHVFECME